MRYIYKCSICGREYKEENSPIYTCKDCGNDGLLDVIYDYNYIKKNWKDCNSYNIVERYKALLPLNKDYNNLPYFVGNAPQYIRDDLGKKIGCNSIIIRDEGRGPTASYKDRASLVCVIKAMEINKDIIAAASTGNAASSLAGVVACFGLKTYIFVPENAPIGKLAQLLLFGARIFRIGDTYDKAFDLCLDATDKMGWYSRNTGYNPVLLEGKKTSALEIFERGIIPDKIIIPVGDGCIYAGIYKGFYDLKEMGFIDNIPYLIGVQAKGANPYVRAINNDFNLEVINPDTIADSISVGNPRVFSQAIRVAKLKNGTFIDVDDESILNAQKELARTTGVFAEPAASAAFAGLFKSRELGLISSKDKVLLLITGNGLKDIDTALNGINLPEPLEPDLNKILENI